MSDFKRIYLEGDDEFINFVLVIAKTYLGTKCNIIDLNPNYKWSDEDEQPNY